MVQGRQPPESLQYIDAKFALERDFGVKFCIFSFTEFSFNSSFLFSEVQASTI